MYSRVFSALKKNCTTLLLSVILVGCGGGGDGQSASTATTETTETTSTNSNQAILGPLSGAEIRAYLLDDLNTVIEGPITADASLTDLDAAGSFSLTLDGVDDDTWILVTATGGQDIDADDNGVVDEVSTQNNGVVHALAKAGEWREGDVNITALSDIAWSYIQDTQAVLTDADALSTRLDEIAQFLLQQETNSDGEINYRDLSEFQPRQHQQNTRVDYQSLLPDTDPGNDTYIDLIVDNQSDTQKLAWLDTQLGTPSWETESAETSADTSDTGSGDTTTSTTEPPNNAPSANAGADQSVNEATGVTLSGSGSDSDGSIASYTWSQTSGGSVSLQNASSATASFTAPALTTAETLTFTLTVTDNEGATSSDSVAVTVNPLNSTPAANAGADQSVNEATGVTLSGSGSDSDGSIASYAWSQTGGSSVSLQNASSATASFTAPALTTAETLTFTLTVTDNEGASAQDTVTVQVNPVLAAPENLIVSRAISGALDISWDTVADAEHYHLYLASETGVTPGTYAALNEGVTVQDITSPYRMTGLSNGVRYYLVVTAESSAAGESEASTEVSEIPYGRLNDTGISWGGDYPSGNNSDCSGETIAQQDCSHGRDVSHNDDSDGHTGFSFTKLDVDGNALAADATEWSCVQDNVTGLIWEVKTDDDGLRDKDWTYTWYNSSGVNDGGSAGTENGGSCVDSSHCDTEKFVQQVNTAGLCGASDWRLPAAEELLSIVDNSRYYPAIDSGYFPNTIASWFWSSSPDANYSGYAWSVNFDNGYVYYDDRSITTGRFVLCAADSDFGFWASGREVMPLMQRMPLWRDANRLLLLIEQAVRHFPRYHKYTLGSDLRRQAMNLCRLIVRACNDNGQRLRHVQRLVDGVDDLKVQIQLAKELQAFRQFTEFQAIAELAVSLGKQSGGWKRRLQRATA